MALWYDPSGYIRVSIPDGQAYFVLVCIVCAVAYRWRRLGLVGRRQPGDSFGAARFEKSVRTVIQAVQDDDDSPSNYSAADFLVFPEAGQQTLFSCQFHKHGITDKKSSEVFRPASVVPCTINFYFTAVAATEGEGGGWTIRGSRRGQQEESSSFFFAIEEGFVAAPSGRAYWVERGKERSILVSGTFHNNAASFSGEWLSSTGDRGSVEDMKLLTNTSNTNDSSTAADYFMLEEDPADALAECGINRTAPMETTTIDVDIGVEGGRRRPQTIPQDTE